MLYEMKITAGLLLSGISRREAAEKIKKNNLYQYPTEKELSRVTKACFNRIDALDSGDLLKVLTTGPVDDAKQVNLYALMRYNAVVGDFMYLVIGEKYRTLDYSFSRGDLDLFFYNLSLDNPKVASWTEKTIQKMEQIITKILAECSYIDSIKSVKLNIVTPFPLLKNVMEERNDIRALRAFNCF